MLLKNHLYLMKVGQNETLQMEQNINNETDNNVFKWPREAILLLIEKYRKRTDDFYSGRISKKKNWQNIAEELLKKKHDVTGPQCQSKFNSLKRTYKSIKDHNGKSGNGSKSWAYYNLMDGLMVPSPVYHQLPLHYRLVNVIILQQKNLLLSLLMLMVVIN